MIMARLTPATTINSGHSAPAVGPLTDIDFLAWIATAEPGAALEYHCGFLCVDCAELVSKLGPSDRKRLLTLSDVAARAERAELVHLVQRRVATDVFAYLAIARPRTRHKTRAVSALIEAGEGVR
jgi:hypothetical protein